MSSIRLEGAGKDFGGQTALHPTDLECAAGKTTVLIGPSGCGKSTILKLMVGLLEPSAGRVLFGDQPVSAANITQIRRRIGYVIQDGGLFPHFTAAENVTLMARHLNHPPQQIEETMDQLRQLTHLDKDALNRYPAALSGGQRQRVSLMRALMLDPDVLLLDEPLGALDPMVRTALQQELKEIFHALAKTVVMVTHDLAEAAWFADSIVLLRQGRIIQQGGLDQLKHQPAQPFVSQFLSAQRGLVSL